MRICLLDKKGTLPGMERKGTKIIFPYSPKAIVSYLKNPSKNALIISPLMGVNSYDKLMIGAVITNYKLPPSRFQFFAAPLVFNRCKKIKWHWENGIFILSFKHI